MKNKPTREALYKIPFNEYLFMRMVEKDEQGNGLTRLTAAFKSKVEATYSKNIKTAQANKKQISKAILHEWNAWEAGRPLDNPTRPRGNFKINNPSLPKRYRKLQNFLTERISIAHMEQSEAKKIAALLNSMDGAELIIQNSTDKVILFYAAICLTHNNAPWALNEHPVSKKIRSAARCAAVLAIIGNDGFRRKSQNKPPGNGPRRPFQKCPRVFVPLISSLN